MGVVQVLNYEEQVCVSGGGQCFCEVLSFVESEVISWGPKDCPSDDLCKVICLADRRAELGTLNWKFLA